MTPGKFWISFDSSIDFLKDLQLWKGTTPHKDRPYSESCNDYSRSEDYNLIYKSLGDYGDYDIILKDNSYLQINMENNSFRFMYIQCPTEFVSFNVFLSNTYKIEPTDEIVNELREELESDYEQYLSEQQINKGAVYLRYDIDERGRKNNENIHAYAHLHIGLNNSIRIPVGMILTPLTFVMFVVRHVYYDNWAKAVRDSVIQKYIDSKSQCESISHDLWTETEQKALFLC